MKSANRFWHPTYLLVALLGAGLVAGCGKDRPAKTEEVKPGSTYFPIKVGGQVMQLQLAALTNEMELGLMQRRDLPADEGMLFLYQKPQRENFYMRNTPTPLDIGYFSPDGVLREIYRMYPNDESSISSKSDQLQFALEVNQGWFTQNGIRPGAQLDLKAVVAALKARGLAAKAYGLSQYDENAN